MARTNVSIPYSSNRLTRKLRTVSVVKCGLSIVVAIFLVSLVCFLRSLILFLDTDYDSFVDRVIRAKRQNDHIGTAVHGISTESSQAEMPSEHGPGELGMPVIIDKDTLGPDDRKKYQDLYNLNFFSQYVSDMISVRRKLPDFRSDECKVDAKSYSENLPDTSVIMCFYNEAWSALIRSMHSVLDPERTPPHLLKEILLVDDGSTQDHLKTMLEEYVAQFAKVRVIRSEKRVGLIKCRLLGHRHATGTVLTFLDSHIECTPGWLEPLLDRIAKNRTTAVWPAIGGLDLDTFEYMKSTEVPGSQVGGFDWALQFTYHYIPERDNRTRAHATAPVRSPTMCGGLFSIDKRYFEYLGTYDEQMEIWGGENVELSFKIWMCGGTLEMVPCSHVGHVFRKESNYTSFAGNTALKRNLARVAEVWLDDYKKYYYELVGNNFGGFGDISERVALRKRLNCTSFQWYLDNVYPEMFIPDRGQQAFGQIQNDAEDGKYCMDGFFDKGTVVGAYPCHGLKGNQFFSYSYAYEIRRYEHCLDYAPGRVILLRCHGQEENQLWIHDTESGRIFNPQSATCLELNLADMTVVPASCNSSLPEQGWTFSNYAEVESDLTDDDWW